MVVCDALTLVGMRAYHKLGLSAKSATEKVLAPFEKSMSYERALNLDGSEKLTEDEKEMLMDIEDE
jgi:hypothetical protein